MANLISFGILILFLWGRTLHKKNRNLHVKIMSTVIVFDTLLVLFLVIHQRALGKIGADMNPILFIHIPFALLTLVGYGFAVRAGRRLLRGDMAARSAMIWTDRFLVPVRILNFVTSLWLTLSR